MAPSILPAVSMPMNAGVIGHNIPGMAIPGMLPPHAATMGLPIAGIPTAGQGLMMQHVGIPTAMGIVRAPPMMAGITGAPQPPLPPGAHFGHPMIRPPMGGHPGKTTHSLFFAILKQRYITKSCQRFVFGAII